MRPAPVSTASESSTDGKDEEDAGWAWRQAFSLHRLSLVPGLNQHFIRGLSRRFRLLKCRVHDRLLLEFVARKRPGRGARRRRAADSGERVVEQHVAEPRPEISPRAHVLGPFLNPEDRRAVAVRRERRGKLLVPQGIELFEPDDGHVVAVQFTTLLVKFIVDLPAARQHARHAVSADDPVRDDALESPAAHLARQALGSRTVTFFYDQVFVKEPGSEVPTPWLCLQHDLRLAGLNPANMDRIPDRSMPENLAALRAGDIDVMQAFQPFVEQAVEEGVGHIWSAAASRGLTAYTALYTTQEVMARDAESLLRMTRAMYRTQQWMAAHTAAELAACVAADFPDLSQTTLTHALARYTTLRLWNRTPMMQPEGLAWLEAACLSGGYIQHRVPYERCVDMRFAAQVIQETPASS